MKKDDPELKRFADGKERTEFIKQIMERIEAWVKFPAACLYMVVFFVNIFSSEFAEGQLELCEKILGCVVSIAIIVYFITKWALKF